MRTLARARIIALALLAAVAGSASVGVAALARAGLCIHRLGIFGLHAVPASQPMGGMVMPMSGMSEIWMGHPSPDGPIPCPILVGIAAFGALCYVVAVIALFVLRPSVRELTLSSARLVGAARLGPLAGMLALAGAIPVGAMIVADGMPAPAEIAVAGIFLVAAALLAAGILLALARIVLVFARRIVVALLSTLRLDALAPRTLRLHLRPALVPAGVLIARRRPSRAPPIRS